MSSFDKHANIMHNILIHQYTKLLLKLHVAFATFKRAVICWMTSQHLMWRIWSHYYETYSSMNSKYIDDVGVQEPTATLKFDYIKHFWWASKFFHFKLLWQKMKSHFITNNNFADSLPTTTTTKQCIFKKWYFVLLAYRNKP